MPEFSRRALRDYIVSNFFEPSFAFRSGLEKFVGASIQLYEADALPDILYYNHIIIGMSNQYTAVRVVLMLEDGEFKWDTNPMITHPQFILSDMFGSSCSPCNPNYYVTNDCT